MPLYAPLFPPPPHTLPLGPPPHTLPLGPLPPPFLPPLALQDPSQWPMQMEALHVLLQLVSYFGRFLSRHAPSVLAVCWRMFGSGLQAHQEGLVEGMEAEVCGGGGG